MRTKGHQTLCWPLGAQDKMEFASILVCVYHVGYRGLEGPVIQQVLAISRLSAPLSPVCRHTFALASTGLHHITI